ncbi:MAG: hypothetical protein MR707_08535 [Galactobacillus timonensis]|uniref:hypothetical protein n=1 Tax=Galactobacillus timonensis TaxID=2041840 RepID=UPI0023F38AE5|nr:hypothetical protein [Galactobacillus timonensis]MCI6068252.1 hypothetical protein [Galactobacillus timonensis]
MVNDLVLNSGKTALVAILLQSFEDDIGIRRTLREQVVDNYRVAGEDRIAFFPACVPMGEDSESVLLCITQSLAADASPPEEFSKVDLLQRELITPLSFHLLQWRVKKNGVTTFVRPFYCTVSAEYYSGCVRRKSPWFSKNA